MFSPHGLAIPAAVSMIDRHAPAAEDEFADTGHRADLYASSDTAHSFRRMSLRAKALVTSRLEVLERRGDGPKLAQALRRPDGQPRENAPVSQSAPSSFDRRPTETR
jgi:hypothetical protein